MATSLPTDVTPRRGSDLALFQRLRWRLMRNALGVLLTRYPVRLVSILTCCLILWSGLFTLAFIGFSELRGRWRFPIDGEIIGLLFDLMFVSLTVLLVFSSGIILYSSLFSSPESHFLLSTPVAA